VVAEYKRLKADHDKRIDCHKRLAYYKKHLHLKLINGNISANPFLWRIDYMPRSKKVKIAAIVTPAPKTAAKTWKRGRVGQEERASILKAHGEGKSLEELAKQFGRSMPVVESILNPIPKPVAKISGTKRPGRPAKIKTLAMPSEMNVLTAIRLIRQLPPADFQFALELITK
jgi:hypothetical protein